MTVLYTARATVTGGRDGRGESDDGKLAVTLSRPGGGGMGTNPEQLFAVGYAACFGSAIAYVAGQRKLETGAINLNSEVTLNQDEHGFFLGVTLAVTMTGIDEKTGTVLVQDAHKVCPYSKATRGNISVTLKLNGKTIS